MGKALVITEKPSVARDIVAALGGFQDHDGYWERDDFVVTFSIGHLVELLPPEEVDPVYKRWTLDLLPILPEEFKLKPKPGTSERMRTLKKLLRRKDVEEVINACDAGREGELIFREIMQFLESDKPVHRLWLQSMTHRAIRAGFDSLEPGEDYDGLGAAARCRSQSDWLIGMNATRALTRRLQGRKERTAWSAGRVQTPTLAIIVARELEILAHVARPYWRIAAQLRAPDHGYEAAWFDPDFRTSGDDSDLRDDRIFDEARAREIAAALEGTSGTARETRKPSRETAPPLFDLTSLQREGNRRFSWSARRTLNAAQRCYEGHKLLTYPRTDSRCLPNDYRETVDEVIRTFAAAAPFGDEARALIERGLENTGRTFDDSGVSDHFAIIPTGKLPEVELRGDDARLFDLVVRRFLASFYPPAIWNRVERVSDVAGHSLRSRSRTLEEPGWRAVIGQTEQEDQALPRLVPGRDEAEGVQVRMQSVEIPAEKTRPAPRISEARLLSLMENAGRSVDDEDLAAVLHEKGIGTPATRADIIENLIQKGYLVRVGKALRPTVKGIRLVDVLERIEADRLASPELTGELEFQLREVERGDRTSEQFMKDMVEYTTQVVDRTKGFDYEDVYPDRDPLGKCPLCERPVYERAWFYRCLENPEAGDGEDCTFRLWKDRAGRYVDRRTARTLLEKKETEVLDGFMTRDGRIYPGALRLEEGKLVLEPAGRADGERAVQDPEYAVDERPLGACPTACGSEVIETPTQYRCKAGLELAERNEALKKEGERPTEKPCPFVLPRTVCKREITRDEAEGYVTSSRTEMLSDFISRFGRPFSARLFVKENGRHGFEFAQRKAGGRKTTRKKTTRKKTGAKTSGKKTTRKKTAAKGARKTPRRKAVRKKRSPGD